MIMGLKFSLLDWGDDLPRELSKFYRVITFDNRASGLSDTPSGFFTISDMAKDAKGLLSALKISRAHVFGISMGGMIAQELALNYPTLVEKLVLGCTACKTTTFSKGALDAFISSGNGDPPIWSLLFSPDFIKKNRTSLTAFWKTVEPHHSKEPAYLAQLSAVMSHNACSRLSKVGAETLILTGDKDPLIPPSNSATLDTLIPKSTARPIKGALHGFPYSHWKETLAELTAFLK